MHVLVNVTHVQSRRALARGAENPSVSSRERRGSLSASKATETRPSLRSTLVQDASNGQR